jgi:hypothetical protein
MKKSQLFPILFAAALMSITACNSTHSADACLKDDLRRKDIVNTMVHHQPYMNEMIHEMMNNDSCNQMMMQNMMNMSLDDTSMCKMMMNKTMELCDKDPAKCKMLKHAMQSHPKVMQSMNGMNGTDHMK